MRQAKAKGKSKAQAVQAKPTSAALSLGTRCKSYRTGEVLFVSRQFGTVCVVDPETKEEEVRDGYAAMNTRGKEEFYRAGDLIADTAKKNYSHIVRVK